MSDSESTEVLQAAPRIAEDDLWASLDKLGEAFCEGHRRYMASARAGWAALSESQREDATLVIADILRTHMEQGGSYRTLLYARLGLSSSMYAPLQMAGLLEIHNLISGELGEARQLPPRIAHLAQSLEKTSQARPLVPMHTASGDPLMHADGTPIMVRDELAQIFSEAANTLGDLARQHARALKLLRYYREHAQFPTEIDAISPVLLLDLTTEIAISHPA